MTKPHHAAIAKRSITIRGHRTSVSLEEAFWQELRALAAARTITLSTLVTQIDEGRQGTNLSSALRLAVLAHVKGQIAPLISQSTIGQ